MLHDQSAYLSLAENMGSTTVAGNICLVSLSKKISYFSVTSVQNVNTQMFVSNIMNSKMYLGRAHIKYRHVSAVLVIILMTISFNNVDMEV